MDISLTDHNFCHLALGAQLAIPAGDRFGNDRIVRSAFCIHRTSKPHAGAHSDAGAATAIGDRIAQHGYGKGMPAEPPGRGVHHSGFLVVRKRRHWKRLVARRRKWILSIVPGHTNFPFGFFMFFSGAAFPVAAGAMFNLGGYDFHLVDLLPPTHAVVALNKIFTLGAGLKDVWFELTALTVLSLIYFLLGVWLFRRMHIK